MGGASAQSGGKAGGGASGTTGAQVGGAPQGGIGGQTSPNIGGGAGATAVFTTVAPEVLGVWNYDWTGGNISYIQIALCQAGRARYLHAAGPKDAAATSREGTYVSLPAQPNRITATFAPDVGATTDPLVIELEFKSGDDSLYRLAASDGYSAAGRRFDPTTWPGVLARLSCD